MIMSSLKALVRHPHSSDQVLIPKCRTKIFKFSYFNRFAKLRNTLPEFTRTLPSLNQFKSQLLQRYSAAFRANYDVTLTLTSGSRFAANAAGHVIFYYLATAATDTSNDCGREPLLYITWKPDFYTSYKVFNVT